MLYALTESDGYVGTFARLLVKEVKRQEEEGRIPGREALVNEVQCK